jgi:hypothetical protein
MKGCEIKKRLNDVFPEAAAAVEFIIHVLK